MQEYSPSPTARRRPCYYGTVPYVHGFFSRPLISRAKSPLINPRHATSTTPSSPSAPPPPPRSRPDGLGRRLESSPPSGRGRCGWSLKFRRKLLDLSAAWLSSPSLFLVCIAGGVRDAGGYVFGYYLATYFSPLMASNQALGSFADDGHCSFSFNPMFEGDQVFSNCR